MYPQLSQENAFIYLFHCFLWMAPNVTNKQLSPRRLLPALNVHHHTCVWVWVCDVVLRLVLCACMCACALCVMYACVLCVQVCMCVHNCMFMGGNVVCARLLYLLHVCVAPLLLSTCHIHQHIARWHPYNAAAHHSIHGAHKWILTNHTTPLITYMAVCVHKASSPISMNHCMMYTASIPRV